MIAYRLTIDEQPTYLHATVEGERTPDNVRRYLKEVYAACAQRGRQAALLEMRFAGASLEVTAIFEVISQASAEGAKLEKIAYVDATTRSPAKADFAEIVAANRAVNVRRFADVAAAVRWLEGGS